MNAGLAVHDGYAYVGNRTDGSPGHPHPGVIIVDVSDPAAPKMAGEIGPPDQGVAGVSSRELRIWPEQDLLIVLNMRCFSAAHRCQGSERASLRFYDLRGARARDPRLVAEIFPSISPHEMFLWIDPARRDHALLYVTSDTPGTEATGLVVFDISNARDGLVEIAATWSGNRELGGKLHSVGVSVDGTKTYLAHLSGGFAVLDTSALARGRSKPRPVLLTPPDAVLRWPPVGPHSAIEIPGTSLVLTTDEIYGGAGACPWGWGRLIDVSDPSRPRFAGELQSEHNRIGSCNDAAASSAYSYSSHNPTVVPGLALVSWHASGLIAASVANGSPAVLATFVPTPLRRVATEDPRLTAGPVKVAMWSTPIVSDGLIYVVDLRNGLYVLRYDGPGADRLGAAVYSEGNSNRAA